MKNQKNSGGLIALVCILCVLVLILGGYIFYEKSLDDNVTNSNDNNQNNINETSEVSVNYKLGDVVKLSKITMEEDSLENENYLEWYVLEENDGYMKLYSKTFWGGKGTLNDIGLTTVYVYNELKEAGYNVSEVRQLNEEELDLFDCSIDFEALANTINNHDNNPTTNNLYSTIKLNNNEVKCNNLPEFIYSSTSSLYTDIQLFGYTLSLGEQFSLNIHNPYALVGFLHPVIILPTNQIG